MIVCVLVLAGIIAALLVINDRKETAWAKERNLLISRIQTPEVAAALAPEMDDLPTPVAVLPDDDEDYWTARREAA